MAQEFFSFEEQKRILDTIQDAENNTSGEIQVHIEKRCKEEVMERAAQLFNILGLHKTAQRNGVLFYLAIKDKKFAILGDMGINEKVPSGFWDNIKEHMQTLFRDGKFTDGLCDGIRMAGNQLSQHFPFHKDDINELSDDISFGKD